MSGGRPRTAIGSPDGTLLGLPAAVGEEENLATVDSDSDVA